MSQPEAFTAIGEGDSLILYTQMGIRKVAVNYILLDNGELELEFAHLINDTGVDDLSPDQIGGVVHTLGFTSLDCLKDFHAHLGEFITYLSED